MGWITKQSVPHAMILRAIVSITIERSRNIRWTYFLAHFFARMAADDALWLASPDRIAPE